MLRNDAPVDILGNTLPDRWNSCHSIQTAHLLISWSVKLSQVSSKNLI